PSVYPRFDALRGCDTPHAPQLPAFVRLGSWLAADRDGNPNVTASITRTAAGIASNSILQALTGAAQDLAKLLTLDAQTTPPSEALTKLWNSQRSLAAEAADDIAANAPNEPHRRVVGMIAHRLEATANRDADLAYPSPDDLLD